MKQHQPHSDLFDLDNAEGLTSGAGILQMIINYHRSNSLSDNSHNEQTVSN